MACNELEWRHTSASFRCVETPNLGRAEANFFRHAASEYDALDGVLVFSGTTLSTHDRLAGVRKLLDGSSEPACRHVSESSRLTPGTMLTCGVAVPECSMHNHANFTLSDPRGCLECLEGGPRCAEGPSPGHVVECEVSYADDGEVRQFTIARAVPNHLAAWLHTHAPGPIDTRAPFCWRGFFRTTGAAVRRRPSAHYRAIHDHMIRHVQPEEAWFIERAALYIFASV